VFSYNEGEVVIMDISKNITLEESNDLETLYTQFFVPIEMAEPGDQSISLQQPSQLTCVESFTTYGITRDLLIYQR